VRGVSGKELVRKAVHMRNPERVPLLYACSLDRSDIVNVEVVRHFLGPDKNISEWGFEWVHIDRNLAMGQPRTALVGSWDDIGKLRAPDPADPARFEKIRAAREQYGDGKYYKANFSLSGFAIMSLLRGFNAMMEDLHSNRDRVEQLADIVFGFEEEVIRRVRDHGYDAVGLADDWGTQQGLFIAPAMWREIFKPRYRRQIEIAHGLGLDVYLHSCGRIFDIVPDLIDIGLDILNPGQPDINGVPELGRRFGGKICFACPVSYQTTGISGSRDDIFAQVKGYVDHLGRFGGGLIGIIPEDSAGLGLTRERLDSMVEAFTLYGAYAKARDGGTA